MPSRTPASVCRLSRLWALALALAAAPLSNAAAQATNYPISQPTSSPIEPARQSFADEDWAKQRTKAISTLLADKKAIRATNVLFVGDSITQFWTTAGSGAWQRSFADPSSPYRGLDLGFAGDRTENLLLHLLPRSSGGEGYLNDPALNPDIIVLLVGVNNTWKTAPPVVEKVVAGNMAIIARLRQLRPRATLIVQSLLPAESVEHTRQFIMPINASLGPLVKSLGPKVRWLDVYPLFVNSDGAPSAKLFGDHVHPNAGGYDVWSLALVEALQNVREP